MSSSSSSNLPPPAPPPPPPPLPPYVPKGPPTKPVQTEPPKPAPAGSYGIGIETEFQLKRRAGANEATLVLFARSCAQAYNAQVAAQFPRMFSLVQAMWDPSQPLYSQWVLHEDPTVGSPPGWWGVELISPLLRDFPGSEWRHDVQAVWDFIAQHYFVGGQKVGDMTCSTHVHISRAEGYSVSDLKKIAQAIIYFEPAFEPILPPDRRGNEYARSNWIDNPSFGYKNLSRDQSIDYLETLTTIDQVIDTMCPNQSKYFGWNFVSVKKFSTIEFRRGPYSATVDDVYMWVDVAESFIKSALAIQSKSQLQQNPVTVGGLETFLTRAPSTGPRYLSRLFAGKTLTARGDPIPVGKLTPSKQALLQKKINADIASQPTLDMIAAAQTDHTFY